MYLGVHFPSDVLLGWLVGALLLWALIRWEKKILAWLNRYPPTEQILIALGVSLALVLIGASVRLALDQWQMPGSWVQLAAQAAPDAEPIDPLAISGLVSQAGVFFGLSMGAILLKGLGGFDAGGEAWKRLARFLVGVLGVFIIWNGLGAVFPRGEYLLAYALRYLRYALVGFWVAGAAPYLFIRLRLAQPQTVEQ
jgi:hypothetical protein